MLLNLHFYEIFVESRNKFYFSNNTYFKQVVCQAEVSGNDLVNFAVIGLYIYLFVYSVV